MAVARGFAIRRLPLSTTIWLAIEPPIACSAVIIENTDSSNAVAVRTDPNDSSTEKSLPASAELELRSHVDGAFGMGTPVCYLLATSGSGPVVISFIR